MRLALLHEGRALDTVVVALAVVGLIDVWAYSAAEPRLAAATGSLLATLPLLLRRRFPFAAPVFVFAAVAVLSVARPEAVRDGASVTLFALLIAFWIAGGRNERNPSLSPPLRSARSRRRARRPGAGPRVARSSSVPGRRRADGQAPVRALSGLMRSSRAGFVAPPPERHEPRDHRDQEHLPEERFKRSQRLRQARHRREIAEAECRQRNETEVDVLRLGVLARLREELAAELVHREKREGEE